MDETDLNFSVWDDDGVALTERLISSGDCVDSVVSSRVGSVVGTVVMFESADTMLIVAMNVVMNALILCMATRALRHKR